VLMVFLSVKLVRIYFSLLQLKCLLERDAQKVICQNDTTQLDKLMQNYSREGIKAGMCDAAQCAPCT